MHLDYWAIRQPPFSSKIDLEHYFESATHEEALARLHFMVQHNRRLGLLLGENGTGKTFIIKLLARQLRRAGCFVSSINLLGIDREEFLWRFANSLCGQVKPDANHVTVWRTIQDRLSTLRYQRIATVVLLDDADECEAEVLTTISRLTQFEQHPDSRLNLVLGCHGRNVELLGDRLLELCELPIELDAFDEIETKKYVVQALERVGRDETTFDEDAFRSLFEATKGIPRAINHLTELCLLVGAADELSVIDRSTVESVQESFRIPAVQADSNVRSGWEEADRQTF